jgi:nickel-dependent lactate racemase
MERVAFELAYGKAKKAVTVAKERLAGPLVRPRPFPETGRSARDTILEVMAQPVGRPRLSDMVAGKVVGLVVSDEFRAGLQQLLAEVMMVEIGAGRPQELRVFIATGTHDPAIYCKNLGPFIESVIPRVGCPVKLYRHDCDASEFAVLGDTRMGTPLMLNRAWMECEVRAYGHESKHHYMAGYSNLDKQIVPGLASRRTVEANHKRSLSPDSGAGRNPWHSDPARQTNPFSEDGRDARAMSERLWVDGDGNVVPRAVETFALDMISQGDQVYWAMAGDPTPVAQAMPAKADEVALFELDKTKYVVISPGGPPACQAMYGVQNCFDMALLGAVASGGEALIIAPCDGRPDVPEEVRGLAPDLKSKELFWDNLVMMREWPLEKCRQHITEHFELYLWKTYRVLRLFKADGVKLYVHSELPDEVLSAAGFLPVHDIEAWVREREARGDGQFRVIDDGNKMCIRGR